MAHFDTQITIEEANNPKIIEKIIEKERPKWTPGTKTGYHAFTYGWLLDQIMRRVDGRSMSKFIYEEFNQKYGKKFNIKY